MVEKESKGSVAGVRLGQTSLAYRPDHASRSPCSAGDVGLESLARGCGRTSVLGLMDCRDTRRGCQQRRHVALFDEMVMEIEAVHDVTLGGSASVH